MAKTTSIALALALEEEAKRQEAEQLRQQEAQIRRDESFAGRFSREDLTVGEMEALKVERRLGISPSPRRRDITQAGRVTFAREPGQPDTGERFDISQDIQGNFWNRIQRTAGGPVILERLKAEYSPDDQQKIHRLYRERSQIATDPTLEGDEDARQAALDDIDDEISRIPLLPPIMREPTAQQQFDASVVRGPNGQMGTWDGKKFNPIEDSKGEVAQQAKWTKDYQSEYNRLLKVEDSGDTPEMLNAKSAQYADLMAVATRSMGRYSGTTAETAQMPLEQDPYAFGLRRGEGTVTVQPDLPKTLEPLWPKLTDEEKGEVRAALGIGVTAQQILDMYKKAVK